jgi:tol-pal system protein YbgF
VHKKLRTRVSNIKISFYFFLLSVFFIFQACATSEDFNLLRRDVTNLQKESLTIRNDLNNLKDKTSGVASEDSFNVVRQSQAEIQSQLSNVSRDIQVLSGRFDENKYSTENALKNSATEMELIKSQISNLEGQIKDIKEKLSTLEGQLSQREAVQKQSRETEKESQLQEEQPATKPLTGNTKQAKYEAAYNTFKAKKYKEARKMFEDFLKDFPKDELTDNAQFWIAETYYWEDDFENAILAYETLLRNFPKSPKIPAALLKQGLSFIEIGDKKTGKIILEQLVERYPDSREASIAKKYMEDSKGNINKKAEKKKK